LFLFEGDNSKVTGVGVREARRFDIDIGEGEGEDIRSLLLTEPLVGVDCAFCGVEIFDRLVELALNTNKLEFTNLSLLIEIRICTCH